MAIKGMMTSRCSLVGTLAVALILLFGVVSALAFPAPGIVTVDNPVRALPGAETETIYAPSQKYVYMGPYEIKGSANGSAFVEAMMCFNAGAAASGGTFVATDTLGASSYFTSTTLYAAEKISMIAWLASQLEGTNPTGRNADINKAIWEIMADYTGNLDNPGLDLTTGSFRLKTDPSISYIDSDINDILGYGFLTDALKHTTDNTAANFLIPLIDGKYDTSKQPFVAPVPEPGTLLLLGSGLVGLGLHGWRKRSKTQK